MDQQRPGGTTTDSPVPVVSCDSHVGPLLQEQLRHYCPQKYLGRFDEFIAAHREAAANAAPGEMVPEYPEMHVAGHHDAAARLFDMDAEGVAAEVIYHFSMNGEPLPFVTNPAGGLGAVPADGLELGAEGYRIYNRWLAEFVSADPDRLLGLAYIPSWDIEASVREVEWAADAGLFGINFPPPGRPGHLEYNNPAWEPFWDVCEATGMSLHTHSGNAGSFDYLSGRGGLDLLVYECGGWMARRAVWWMIHGWVFERHPRLRLVITEQFEGWWLSTMAELDAIYGRFNVNKGGPRLPRSPSEYLTENVLMGASFLSSHLANEAWRAEYAGNVLWGRDYPHTEGTFHVMGDGDPSISRLSLRNALAGLPEREATMIAGTNAIEAFGLNRDRLTQVALDIGGPSAKELVTAPQRLPPVREISNAFRGQAGARRVEAVPPNSSRSITVGPAPTGERHGL